MIDFWHPKALLWNVVETLLVFLPGLMMTGTVALVLETEHLKALKMPAVETFGRLAYTEGGLLVQHVHITHVDGQGEVVKEEDVWEVVRRLSDKESFYLRKSPEPGILVRDLTVPGAQLRK